MIQIFQFVILKIMSLEIQLKHYNRWLNIVLLCRFIIFIIFLFLIFYYYINIFVGFKIVLDTLNFKTKHELQVLLFIKDYNMQICINLYMQWFINSFKCISIMIIITQKFITLKWTKPDEFLLYTVSVSSGW